MNVLDCEIDRGDSCSTTSHKKSHEGSLHEKILNLTFAPGIYNFANNDSSPQVLNGDLTLFI